MEQVITLSDSYRMYRDGGNDYRRRNYSGRGRKYRRRSRWPLIICCIVLVASVAAIIYLNTRPQDEPTEAPVASADVSTQAPETSVSSADDVSSAAESSAVSSSEPESSSTPSVPVVSDDPNKTITQVGGVLLYGNDGLEAFGGSDSVAQNYAKTVSSFKQALGDGVTVYNMVVPTHVEFALPDRLKGYSSDQRHNLDAIYSGYTADVKPVDVYDSLSYKRDEYIYFNTDHHWTALGAYYAYQKLGEVAGFEPIDITSLEKRTIENYRGTLYTETKSQLLYDNPDHVDYYMIPGDYSVQICHINTSPVLQEATLYAEFASGSNSYSVFIWGDNPLTVIQNPIGTGRKIAVIKDSFGNALCPYLVANYDEVHVIDMRYFSQYQKNAVKYIQDSGIDEVLILNNIMAANTGMRIQNLQNLMSN